MLPFDYFKHNKYDSTLPTEIPNGLRSRTCPAGCGAGAGVNSAWGQKKLEATLREMLVNRARRPFGRQSPAACPEPVEGSSAPM